MNSNGTVLKSGVPKFCHEAKFGKLPYLVVTNDARALINALLNLKHFLKPRS
uniref:Uncharacterized protein n=1 Tax=Anguilla anguilla TaxID=7936 RepID=A0A0E9X3S0_ANGAN